MHFKFLLAYLVAGAAVALSAATPKAEANSVKTPDVIANVGEAPADLGKRAPDAEARWCGRPGEPCWV